jgi:hypothetical protein
MPDFFLQNMQRQMRHEGYHTDKSSIVPILSFLDIEVTKAGVLSPRPHDVERQG